MKEENNKKTEDEAARWDHDKMMHKTVAAVNRKFEIINSTTQDRTKWRHRIRSQNGRT